MCTYIGPHPFCYQKCLQVFAATETFCLHTQLHSFSSIMGPHSIINSHRPYLLVTQSLCGRWVPHFPSFTCPMQDHTQFSWFLQDYDFDLIPREGRETNNYPLGFICQGPTPAGCMVRLSTTFKHHWSICLGTPAFYRITESFPGCWLSEKPSSKSTKPWPQAPAAPPRSAHTAMILSRDLSEQGPASSEILVILKEPLKGLRAHQKCRVIL